MDCADLLIESGQFHADRIDAYQPLRVRNDRWMLRQLTVNETFDQCDPVQCLVHGVATRTETVEFFLTHSAQSGRIVGMDEDRLRTEIQLIDEVMRALSDLLSDRSTSARTRIAAGTGIHDWLDRRNRLLGLPSCG